MLLEFTRHPRAFNDKPLRGELRAFNVTSHGNFAKLHSTTQTTSVPARNGGLSQQLSLNDLVTTALCLCYTGETTKASRCAQVTTSAARGGTCARARFGAAARGGLCRQSRPGAQPQRGVSDETRKHDADSVYTAVSSTGQCIKTGQRARARRIPLPVGRPQGRPQKSSKPLCFSIMHTKGWLPAKHAAGGDRVARTEPPAWRRHFVDFRVALRRPRPRPDVGR